MTQSTDKRERLNRAPQGNFPSRFPIDVTPETWFYENAGSISVVLKGQQERIPLRQLAVIVDRYRKYRAKRRKK